MKQNKWRMTMVNKDMSLKKLIKLKVLDSNIMIASNSPYKITVQLDKFIPSRSLKSSHLTLTGALQKSKVKKINLDFRTKLLTIQVAPFENLNFQHNEEKSRILIPLCNSKKAGYIDLNLLCPSAHLSLVPVSRDIGSDSEAENEVPTINLKVKLANAYYNGHLSSENFVLGKAFKNMSIDSVLRLDSYTALLSLTGDYAKDETGNIISTGEIIINPSATNSLITLNSFVEI